MFRPQDAVHEAQDPGSSLSCLPFWRGCSAGGPAWALCSLGRKVALGWTSFPTHDLCGQRPGLPHARRRRPPGAERGTERLSVKVTQRHGDKSTLGKGPHGPGGAGRGGGSRGRGRCCPLLFWLPGRRAQPGPHTDAETWEVGSGRRVHLRLGVTGSGHRGAHRAPGQLCCGPVFQ